MHAPLLKTSHRRIGQAIFLAALALACAPTCAAAGNANIPQWGLDANKTPTPAYAKGFPAVVLYDETIETFDDKGRNVERHRWAVRILNHQGIEQRCEAEYDIDEKINYLRAWTIAADQKQYQAKETDFVEVGASNDRVLLSTRKVRVANTPGVDVGATIFCESEELMPPYMQETIWGIQESIPIVDQVLEVDLPAGRTPFSAWHHYKPVPPAVVGANEYRWEIKDMPGLDVRDVSSRPKWSALAARMTVQWGSAAVEGKDNQWQAIGKWFTDLEVGRPDPSPEITAQTQSLIAGAPDFYTKLHRITQYVQDNIRYFIVERGIGGLQANHAADIFRNRYGDCKDKTTILISMLDVAGIRAYYVLVDDRRGVVDPDAPSNYGNHMITAIAIPPDVNDPRLMAIVKSPSGKRYLIFDPTNETVPVGELPEYEEGSYGILSAGADSQLLALPVLTPDANSNERTGKFTLAFDGSLTGSVDVVRSGWDGAYLREELKLTDEKERRESLEKDIAGDIPGASLDSFKYAEPPELDKPIDLTYSLSAAQYAHPAGQLLLVRPRVVGDYAQPFEDKPRTLPIELGSTGKWDDNFDIAIPAGYVVDDTPDPVNVDLDFASFHSSVSAKGSLLHYQSELTVRQVEIPATRAADFRRLEGLILASEKGTAVLKKQ